MSRCLPFALAVTIAIALTGCQDQSPSTGADQGPSPSNSTTVESSPAGDAASSAPQSDTPTEIELDSPTLQNPVVAGSAISPETAAPGSTGTLTVRAKIINDWHIYAVGMPAGVGIPTQLDLRLPDSVTPDGDWTTPDAEPYVSGGDPCFVYHRDIVFHRKLKIADSASPGVIDIGCDFNYQACNEAMCLPPKKLELTARWAVDPK